jgi:thiopeptide-type bacteriocin biosynthesis protein
MTWAAVHVFYHGNQDPLIRHGIGPALAELHDAGLSDHSFFLRYWEGGPHVRVRIRAANEAAAELAAGRLAAAVQGYLGRQPSRLPVDPAVFAEAEQWLAGMEDRDVGTTLYPDNTVVRAAYKPEYGKYGGAVGVAIAEDVFDSSSRLVLALLDEVARRPGRRLLYGLALLATGLREFDVADPREFLAGYASAWSRYAIPAVTERWPQAMIRDRQAAAACVGASLAGVPPAAIEPWAAALRSAYGQLAEAGEDVLGLSLARLMTQYVHTTSNRLGLLPADEAYLAVLAASVIPESAVTSQ